MLVAFAAFLFRRMQGEYNVNSRPRPMQPQSPRFGGSRFQEDTMTAANPRLEDIERDVREAIRSHWVLFLIQGLIMMVLGLLAVGEPMLATLAVEIFAGWLFLISGIVGLAGVFTGRRVPGFWWALITALLAIAVGLYLIWRPLAGIVSLTLAVAAYFGAQGIVQIITAIAHRGVLPSWIWVMLGGVVNVVLAIIILSGWPGTVAWTLGLLFGINLFMWGLSLVMTALACRAVRAAA
jgi:uncharacterized membrane protein HdeD (DUF308 family)